MCKLLSGIGGNSSNMPTTPKLRQRGEVNSPFLCLRVNGGSLIYKLNIGEETPVLDKLVFHKIKERLGGRIRLMVSGSAPLSPALHEFLEVYVYCLFPLPIIHNNNNNKIVSFVVPYCKAMVYPRPLHVVPFPRRVLRPMDTSVFLLLAMVCLPLCFFVFFFGEPSHLINTKKQKYRG